MAIESVARYYWMELSSLVFTCEQDVYLPSYTCSEVEKLGTKNIIKIMGNNIFENTGL